MRELGVCGIVSNVCGNGPNMCGNRPNVCGRPSGHGKQDSEEKKLDPVLKKVTFEKMKCLRPSKVKKSDLF